jgi:hypothetical protein
MATSDTGTGKEPTVKTRRVHYIGGFDPRGARYYHRLYREEAPKQSRLNGSILEVGERRKISPQVSAWTIKGVWAGQSVETEYEFIAWDDLVRRHWVSGASQLFLGGLWFYRRYISMGCLGRVRRVAPNAFYTAALPLFYFLGWTATLMLVALLVGGVLRLWCGNVWIGAGVALLLALALGNWALRRAERTSVLWILRTCLFVFSWGERPLAELDERMEEIAARIVREQENHPVDEVLIVGHSVGSIVAATVTALILEKTPPEKTPPHLHLLTLGECIPYLSFIPTATVMRRHLEILGNDSRIPWTDASSPPDPLCFFQVNPIQATGLTVREPNKPRLITVRIFRMFPPATYAKMRRDKQRIHFQYLMASELPSDYDYFLITAGPRKFAQPA